MRQPFPDDIPHERVVIAAPTSCPCCGCHRLSKLGEDVTRTLEEIPRRWKVIETVREKFSCRDCETITQPPAPFHVTPRGFIGPQLLTTILFDKFGSTALEPPEPALQMRGHRALGLDARRSGWRGAFAVMPLYRLIEAHVLAAERLFGDDTTVPILAKGKTVTGRIWTYVRDDRPFDGTAPPAALYYASTDRRGDIRHGTWRASPAFSRPTPIGLQCPLRCGAQASADNARPVLGACEEALLRARRYCRMRAEATSQR